MPRHLLPNRCSTAAGLGRGAGRGRRWREDAVNDVNDAGAGADVGRSHLGRGLVARPCARTTVGRTRTGRGSCGAGGQLQPPPPPPLPGGERGPPLSPFTKILPPSSETVRLWPSSSVGTVMGWPPFCVRRRVWGAGASHAKLGLLLAPCRNPVCLLGEGASMRLANASCHAACPRSPAPLPLRALHPTPS